MQNLPEKPIEIVPAVLAEDKVTFFELTEKAFSFASRIQFDFMDGKFVPSTSVPVSMLKEVAAKYDFQNVAVEVHLMVFNPEKHAEVLRDTGVSTVIFHFEAVSLPLDTLNYFKEFGLEVGLAINPETSIGSIKDIVREFDLIMFMTVKPGYYGSPLEIGVLEKIKAFKEEFPDVLTAVDGGVKPDNLDMFIEAGATRICVGSAIMKADNPKEIYEKMTEKLSKRWF